MTARDAESALFARCAAAAREAAQPAQDQREANVFRLAAMVVRSRFPSESMRLMQASERYFASHPNARLASADVVRKGWVPSLPRLRDMLSHRLYGYMATNQFETEPAGAVGLARKVESERMP
ncbi:conserved protein of unknown function [Sterolibacterium denitrificans]|uniref:Uncharacterized protein n=1 Tax=Sterolibacterium denitrificans TaxID=157592 RepID=A0A7Z7HSU2_9PROT|nr:hypothetical protein [Sterolibacterium denitrificans]SMB30418.1 conserved protein of unknown function [Sterolibacterium denitrificans]